MMTPAIEIVALEADAGEPTAAENPCEVKQAASAALLGFTEVELAAAVEPWLAPELVVARLATDGVFEPPQPVTARPSAARNAASTSQRRVGVRRVAIPSAGPDRSSDRFTLEAKQRTVKRG